MKPPFSSDPEARFVAWEQALAQEVAMADGSIESIDYGSWAKIAINAALRGRVSSMTLILDELYRLRNPKRRRAQASLRQAAQATQPVRRMSSFIRESDCWAFHRGVAGMGLTLVEDGKVKISGWVLREGARHFPFKLTPSAYGSLVQEAEGMAGLSSSERRALLDELSRLSPPAQLVTLPDKPARPSTPRDDWTALERVLAKTMDAPDGTTFTIYEAISNRLIAEVSKGNERAIKLLSRERDRTSKHRAKKIQPGCSAPPLIARTIRFNFGMAGASEVFEELGITASVYPRFLLFSWILDAAWKRGGRPDDPEAFKSFIRNWVLGELATVPQEYRPDPKVADPPTAA